MTEERKKRKLQWERAFGLFLALILFFGFQSALRVQAADTEAQQKATTGTLSVGITWSYDAGTKTLTVSGSGLLHGTYEGSPFDTICAENEVERIVFQNCKLKRNGIQTGTVSAEYLFYGLTGIKELDLSGLDTSNVMSMDRMFYGCSGLTSLDLSGLDTSNVMSMESMFYGCSDLTSLDLSGFDTKNVRSMVDMFDGCNGLMSLDLSGFEIGSGTYTNHMFSSWPFTPPSVLKAPKAVGREIPLNAFYQDEEGKVYTALTAENAGKELKKTEGENGGITWSYDAETKTLTVSGEDELVARSGGPFKTICARSEVERIVFRDCKLKGSAKDLLDKLTDIKELDLSGLDTGNVTDMYGMFNGCSGLTSLDLSKLDTGNVTDMGFMFNGCSGLTNLDLSKLDTGNVTNMSAMFQGCSGLTSLDVSGFDTGNVTDMGFMFNGCSGLTNLDLSKFDTGNVTDMGAMFNGCSGLRSLDLSKLDTGNVTNMGTMFDCCSGLTSLDLSELDTGNVTGMGFMFNGCSGLTSLDVSGLDTGNVTDMGFMFSGCSGLRSLDVSGLDTGNVTDMGFMFNGCSGLTSLDLSKLDTGNVTDMSAMFQGCSGLTNLDVSGFNTGNVTDMGAMFSGCSGLRSLDLSKLDTGNVTDMNSMFRGCSGLTILDVSGLDTGNVTNMCVMFSGCSGLTILDVSGFEIGSTTNTNWMFNGCTPSVLKAPRTVAQGMEIGLDISYRDAAGKVYLALMAENAGRKLRRADLEYPVFYEIHFDGNGSTGGSTAKLTDCEEGTSYTLPANGFTRTGYTFTGWNTKADGTGTAYADKASVKDLATENGAVVTLYAQWKANSYSIAFKGNGATEGEMNTLTNRKVGTSYTLPANKFKRTGYSFTGWNTKKDGSGTAYANKAMVKDLTKTNGATVTLYAQWKINRYSIAFKGNGATEGEMKTLENRQVGKSYTLPANKFKRTGYTFTGWNTKKDGSGTAYANKASVKDLTKTNGVTVTLYAQWKKNAVTYKIKFNANSGTGKMSALKCKTGTSYKLPANAFKKQGYTFAGWNTKKDGKGKSFKNKASVKDLTKKSGATVTLYAQWKPNTYTVKFDGNKATSGKMKDIENCQYDKSFKLTKSAYKRKGYTFAGWNTKKNGTGKSYKNGAQVKNLTAKNKGTVVLYAQWVKKK